MVTSESRNQGAGGASSEPQFAYRRQFVIGKGIAPPAANWQHVQFGQFSVYGHPDLTITNGRRACQVVLLGYIFDPESPSASNADITDRLAEVGEFDELFAALDRYGGTFVVLVRSECGHRLIHDAAGLREVYYTIGSDTVVASQPALLETCVPFKEHSSKPAKAFFESDAFRHSGRLWPSHHTLYRNVRHLMPNHYLDLDRGAAVRYWPRRPRRKASVDQTADQTARWLDGFLRAATRRYSVSLGVTAGLDSRVLVAASRPYRDDVSYFVIRHPEGGSTDRVDRRIAKRLARRLGVPLSVREYGQPPPESFEEAYAKSVTFARESLASEWYDVFYRASREGMTINGNVSEVARTYFERKEDVTGEHLSRLIYGEELPFAVDAYDDWLKEVRPLCSEYGYDVLDLFYWEERMGNWAARGRSEMHLVTEVFTPYDCRHLLELLLSVDPSERQKLDNRLYRDIIRRLWPEALEEPINPRLKLYLSRWMRRLHVYGPVTRLVSKLRS